MGSDISAATVEPIRLRAERGRRLLLALLVIAALVVIAVAVVTFAGQAFGTDPMAGT